jgi:hypothetical protein
VISLLSAEKPNLDSPANVDAAVEVRNDFDGAVPSIEYGVIAKWDYRLQEESTSLGTSERGRSFRLVGGWWGIVPSDDDPSLLV